MKVLGNILWVILGGLIMALGWILAGVICCITIIGIPLGIQAFKMAQLVFWPFGKTVDYSKMGTGSVLLNILWLLIFGWGLALGSAILGLVYCITIIGIPFGLQWFKFAKLALLPFGAEIIDTR
ncbi:YccF domain-containing protein [Acetobacterium paludosum]|uniref:YccF domain-containing protein n=1 Tax=Acetobacterium paludosum TaxID=52693 RepID=A0A923KTE9_9FIRM|nr:YccF domain-containing protein [Acetobacterium paludosum]MBC3889342.1 YccF domain-containing protein [Acetobacterium paludosum]